MTTPITTKAEAIAALKSLYRAFNRADSDEKLGWTQPVMAGQGGCSKIDDIFYAMLEADILTTDEHQAIYDTL